MGWSFRMVLIALLTASWAVLAVPDVSAQWVECGLNGEIVPALASNGDTLFAGASNPLSNKGGVYISTNQGVTWSDTGIGSHEVSALALCGENVFAGTLPQPGSAQSYESGIYRSTDNGNTWAFADIGISDSNIITLAVLGASSPLPVIFAGTEYSGVFRSTNNGASWIAANNGMNTTLIEDFAEINSSSAMIFAATFGGIYRSSDSGSSWEPMNNGLTDTNVFSIAVGENTLLAGTYLGGVFASSDNGTHWFPSNAGSTNIGSSSIYFLTVSGSIVFAASPNTVFFSTNNGADWESADVSVPDGIESLHILGSNLFVGTRNGLWVRPISDFGISAVAPVASINNSLANYPNPFTQSTTISFSTPESGVASVSIVNILGTEVARIYSGELGAGEHSFQWDASGLAPGMYECIVQMNGGIERVPMVLTK